MSKHFYPEAVYNDQGEKPQMRWRKRRTFTELAASYDDDDVNEAKPQSTSTGLQNPHNRSVSHGSDASKTKPGVQNSSVSYSLSFVVLYPLQMLSISVCNLESYSGKFGWRNGG